MKRLPRHVIERGGDPFLGDFMVNVLSNVFFFYDDRKKRFTIRHIQVYIIREKKGIIS